MSIDSLSTSSSPSMPVAPQAGKPWYRYPLVWMVISGPLIVVVASFVSAYFAVHGQDPVLLREEVPEKLKDMKAGTTSLTPAEMARNHAAKTKPVDD